MKCHLTVRLSIEMEDVRALRDIVEATARLAGFLEPEAAEVVLAVHEAVANVRRHGYSEEGEGPVVVRIRARSDEVEFFIVDSSPPVPTETICPREWDDAKPGGMGLPFMHKVMDVVEHHPRDGRGNVLRMLRRRRREPEPRENPEC